MNLRTCCIVFVCACWASPAFCCDGNFLFADSFNDLPEIPPPPGPNQVQPGDVCETALAISPGFSQQTTRCLVNNYAAGPGCNIAQTTGPDRVYAIAVPSGFTLTVTAQPPAFVNMAIMLVGGSGACPAMPTCLSGADQNGPSIAETVSWTNLSGTASNVRIIISGVGPQDFGAFTLNLLLGN